MAPQWFEGPTTCSRTWASPRVSPWRLLPTFPATSAEPTLPPIPPEVQANLPTGPDNFPKTVFQDFDWWANEGQKAYDAFNAFLLG